ncbi:glycoside hydrolase family 95 protein [Paenibacillus popilliae]|nr:glycoside hydrolase family 95 protein [Paenibacillus popilliae]
MTKDRVDRLWYRESAGQWMEALPTGTGAWGPYNLAG